MKKDAENPSALTKWTLLDLIERLPDLSLVIDLTNTNRYYHPGNLKKLKRKKKEVEKQLNHETHLEHQTLDNIDKSSLDSSNPHCNDRVKNDSVETSDIDQLTISNTSVEIKYVKIYTQGHVVPDDKVVQK